MDGYRECAGIVLFNDDGKVLMCARADQNGYAWQFPQGGIEKGEKPEDAALRELKEETSVTSAEIILSLAEPVSYLFPKAVYTKFLKNGTAYVGQNMHWFLIHFKGADDEINLNTQTPEFKAYKWEDFKNAHKDIIYFKRKVYRKVCHLMLPYMEAYVRHNKEENKM